jgi:hypothetical protein
MEPDVELDLVDEIIRRPVIGKADGLGNIGTH